MDWKIREGYLSEAFPHRFPLVLGWEFAGEVAAVGYAARRFDVGDKVHPCLHCLSWYCAFAIPPKRHS